MRNDENSDIFGNWLEGKLTPQQRPEFERLCAEDEAFSQQVEAANAMMMQAESYKPEAVPDWDRTSTFEQVKASKWWHWQGLPALSLGTSMLAIVMVLSGLEVRTDDGAMTISFAGQQDSKKIEKMVTDKLNEYQQNQQVAMNTFAQSLQQQQLDASGQLTQYLLTSSRQERREDFAELIKFVNEQRNDDQLFYARQLNKLQEDIYTNPDPINWPQEAGVDRIKE